MGMICFHLPHTTPNVEMVLRTDLDKVDGAMHEASTEQVHEFFCYRCNLTKKSRHRVFWHVPGGTQVLCKPCGDEIRAKAVSKKRKKNMFFLKKIYLFIFSSSQERRKKNRKAPTAVVATPVVCPNLLQLEEERASIESNEFVTRLVALIAAELRQGLGPHFFQVYETTMQV
jgi:hypothetical protein